MKLIVDLIKSNTTLDSNAAIAKRLHIAEATLRGYWDSDKAVVPRIPEKQVAAFCALLMEILPAPLTESAAQALLRGSALSFHNALLPVGGSAWKRLIDTFSIPASLEVIVKPQARLSFGEPDDEDTLQPTAIVRLHQRFFFRSNELPWRGEAALIAEHMGMWHITNVSQKQRIVEVEGRNLEIPLQREPRPVCLMERTKPGAYRYFAIAVRGQMPGYLREHLYGPNPLDSSRLNLIAEGFIALEKDACVVIGATIMVTDT